MRWPVFFLAAGQAVFCRGSGLTRSIPVLYWVMVKLTEDGYQDSREGFTCQLVTTVNPESSEFECLTDPAGARAGPATRLGLLRRNLSLERHELDWDLSNVRSNLSEGVPIEVAVHWTCFHSCLLIDLIRRKEWGHISILTRALRALRARAEER